MKALLALEDAKERCHEAPLPRSYALRFTLAFLYAHSDGTRWPFDQFWQSVTRHPPSSDRLPPAVAGTGRHAGAYGALNGIYHALGIERTRELQFEMERKVGHADLSKTG